MSCNNCQTAPCFCGKDYVSLPIDKLDDLIDTLKRVKRIKTNKLKKNKAVDHINEYAHQRGNPSDILHDIKEIEGLSKKYSDDQLEKLADNIYRNTYEVPLDISFDPETMEVLSIETVDPF